MNAYLDPPADAEEQAAALTACGFPFEGQEDLEDGDIQQEIEMASNRGDCVCHTGMAREIAALTGRTFTPPECTPNTAPTSGEANFQVTNHEPESCPLYTAQLISGVKVGPSPEWLQKRLRAIGQIPRNNLVDATNFVLFEMGQPTHVFDRDLLKGDTIHIRHAKNGEAFLPIGEDAEAIKLTSDDLVIADDQQAVALAGVKGGATTAVSETTTNILVEAATFDQLSVRNSSRRHGIASDSSYRFERGVHPAEVAAAADRLITLILDIAGGTLHSGVIADGAPIPALHVVEMRTERCRQLLGHQISDEEMVERLATLDFQPVLSDGSITCTVPARRLDISAEIDLIEEVARAHGLEKLEVNDSIEITVAPPQGEQLAINLMRERLVGAGFVETISHSLISERSAEGFLDDGHTCLRVTDDRAGGEPLLRPSVLPSLLQVAERNRNRAGAHIRAFEMAAIFDESPSGHRERRVIGMLIDGKSDTDATESYRSLRGCIAELSTSLLGSDDLLDFAPTSDDDTTASWLTPSATITLQGEPIGHLGIIRDDIAQRFDAAGPIAAAELQLPPLISNYPPQVEAKPLPAFPPIDRDLSVTLAESVSWADVETTAQNAGGELLEQVSYVTTWRGKQLGSDRKSVTMHLRFRDPEKTLRHEDVDPHVQIITKALIEQLGGEIRS